MVIMLALHHLLPLECCERVSRYYHGNSKNIRTLLTPPRRIVLFATSTPYCSTAEAVGGNVAEYNNAAVGFMYRVYFTVPGVLL